MEKRKDNEERIGVVYALAERRQRTGGILREVRMGEHRPLRLTCRA